jgi:4-hydroxy-4-methyl-2-oxoglutarate aldolase
MTDLNGLAVAVISDALDRLGIAGTCAGITPVHPGFRVCGEAFTIRYRPCDPRAPGSVGDYIDDVPPGAVVTIDNAGRVDCTVWGGLLTEAAHRRGIAGTVIDGACRDGQRAADLSQPVFSRTRFMRTGKDRVEMEAIGEPVRIGGVPVRAGDLVCGDGDGVVVVPAEAVAEVAVVAARIEAAEADIIRAVRAGATLAEARSAHGYHTLQRKAAAP